MSLLMDALRRAEADKRAASAAATLEEPLVEHFDLRLEPGPDEAQTPAPGPSRPAAADLARVLELGSDDPTLVDEFLLDSPGPNVNPDDATLGRPERVTPQTVFAAGGRSSSQRQTLALAAAAFLGVASLGVVAWRMLAGDGSSLPTPHAEGVPEAAAISGPPPAGTSSDLALTAGPEGVVSPLNDGPGQAAVPATPFDATAGIAGSNTAISTPAVPIVPVDSATESTPRPLISSGIARATEQESAAVEVTVPSEKNNAAKAADGSPQPQPASTPSAATDAALKIARQQPRSTRAEAAVTQAYAAWLADDLPRARQGYDTALAADPQNLDAHLGLGAIALRENALAEARGHYREALALAPQDPVAMAALSLLEAGSEGAIAAAQLASLSETSDPYVQFALGNRHALAGRWREARLSYQAAAAGEPANADYAFNHAVSLDQLGLPAAAATEYARALSLHGPASRFDATAVRARLLALQSSKAAP